MDYYELDERDPSWTNWRWRCRASAHPELSHILIFNEYLLKIENNHKYDVEANLTLFWIVKEIKVIRTVWAVKQLKDYIIDACRCESMRPLGGAVSLLRQRSFCFQRRKTTNLNKEILDVHWLLYLHCISWTFPSYRMVTSLPTETPFLIKLAFNHASTGALVLVILMCFYEPLAVSFWCLTLLKMQQESKAASGLGREFCSAEVSLSMTVFWVSVIP